MVSGQTGGYGWVYGMGGWVGLQMLITFLGRFIVYKGGCIGFVTEMVT
jgi:hypothetical protein